MNSAIAAGIVAGVLCGVVVSIVSILIADWYGDARRRQRGVERAVSYRRALDDLTARVRAGDSADTRNFGLSTSDRLTLEDHEQLAEALHAESLRRLIDDGMGIGGLGNLTPEQVDHLRRSIVISIDWPEERSLGHFLKTGLWRPGRPRLFGLAARLRARRRD